MTETCEEVVALNRNRRGGRRARPKPPAEPEPPRIPRITRLMALGIKFQDMVDRGEVHDYADLARLGVVTRARMTQIMNMLLLAPHIQCALLTEVANNPHRQSAHERMIRAVVRSPLWADQREAWAGMEAHKRSAGCSTQPGESEGPVLAAARRSMKT